MAASSLDKLTDTRNAARPNSARVSSGRSGGGTTLACDNLSGWPTASKVHFVTYRIDSNSKPVAGTQLDCSGIVSGNNIGSLTVIDGTDTGNLVNDVVEMLPTAAWGQDLADALTTQHTRTGTHKNITNTGGIATDTLAATGNTTVGGTLGVTGATTLTGAVGGAGYSLATISNPYKFRVHLATAQTISSNTFTKVPFDTKDFDTGSNFDAVTNHRFTAPIAGFYQFNASAENISGSAARNLVSIYVNGSEYSRGNDARTDTITTGGAGVSDFIQLSATDFVEIFFLTSGTNIAATNTDGKYATYFSGFLVSAT